MDAVAEMGRIIKEDAPRSRADAGRTRAAPSSSFSATRSRITRLWRARSTAWARPSASVNVGVSGPGVVYQALQECKGESFDVVAETIKQTAFKITRMGQLVAREASRRLDVPFGIVDLSLAPTPGGGRQRGAHSRRNGTGGLRHARHDGRARHAQRRGEKGRRDGLRPRRRAFRRVYPGLGGRGHDRRGARTARSTLDKLEAMTCVCSVGLDMIAVPGDTTAETISAIIADEAAIGMVNNKTTAVRLIPVAGQDRGRHGRDRRSSRLRAGHAGAPRRRARSSSPAAAASPPRSTR